MAGQPLHAAAEAPMARAPWHNHAVEVVLAHLVAQRPVPPLVFLLGKMIIDRVTVIWRLVHVGEWRVLIQALAHLFPRLMRGRTRHLDVHGISILSASDANTPARGLDASLCEIYVRDRLDRRLLILVDAAVL